MKKLIWALLIFAITASARDVWVQGSCKNIAIWDMPYKNVQETALICKVGGGTQLALIDSSGVWYKVKTNDGKTGWIVSYFTLNTKTTKLTISSNDYCGKLIYESWDSQGHWQKYENGRHSYLYLNGKLIDHTVIY